MLSVLGSKMKRHVIKQRVFLLINNHWGTLVLKELKFSINDYF